MKSKLDELVNYIDNNTQPELYLERKDIKDDEVNIISQALKKNSSFTKINLGYNFIGDKGAKIIADALKEKNHLFLELQMNKIGDEGIKAIKEIIAQNNIKYLGLQWNWISKKGIETLSKVLEMNVSLTEINLRNNIIDNESAKHIARILKTNNSLIKILFGSNTFGEEGVKIIADVYLKSNSLTYIELPYGNFNEIEKSPIGLIELHRQKNINEALNLSNFLIEKFTKNKEVKINYCNILKLKQFQNINMNFITIELKDASEENKLTINEINYFIRKNFFELIGVCKNFNNESPLSELSLEVILHIIHFLEPCSLSKVANHTILNEHSFNNEDPILPLIGDT